ncbi:MAG TPA: PEP/pyruvate-binding domain-containing protein [Phycisphaerae bacterium]|nr:PEP/pyruvate-binding domain-containing protein [Phycisphaerae bacterium]HNU45428.1 PEP/pyruvate-binding domain-containing protein [Phycisphaerae bacterium]
MAAKHKWVYGFGDGKAEGRSDQREVLGGKGAGLAEMMRIGLPVPPGFTISTHACAHYTAHGKWPAGLEKDVRQALARLERVARKKLGSRHDPLLVSVRSGAAASMPGMMETILNLGLNDESVEGLAEAAGNRRFAFDAYRRFITMYGCTAKGVRRSLFDDAFDQIKRERTAPRLGRASGAKVVDTDVNAEELEALVQRYREIYRAQTGEDFPQDPFEQLRGSISAVFGSWMAEKAVTYRRVEQISGLIGTAVNVCQMVFGNMGDDCGTGVCFTRDPNSGENIYYGDLLINAQGEDVVAGIRTPMKLAELHTLMPAVYDQLEAVRVILEVHYRDMQDLEFTIERGKLYMLQCRRGKRSPAATFRIAVEQATAGVVSKSQAAYLVKKKLLPKAVAAAAGKPVISKDEAVTRVRPEDIERLFYPVLDPTISALELEQRTLGEGTGAVPGAASGEIMFTAHDAETRAAQGHSVILVRKETSPEDVGGMHVAAGILTATGGKTSHAAVVARGWGKCCIVGCEALNINCNDKSLTVHGRTLREGDAITLDGGTGRIFEGKIELVRPTAPPEYDTLMSWCDQRRQLQVRTNADTPPDAERAVKMGAQGIGLCRTEHMFFDPTQPQRIRAMREMILADNEAGRRRALSKLLVFQRADFEGIFTAMEGLPVTVRLLDPPLHEFLPHDDNPEGQHAVAEEFNAPIREQLAKVEAWDHNLRAKLEAQLITIEDIRRRVALLEESNPMLGHRGCRLCITYPEILETQVRAIMEAAVNCTKRGLKVLPEIMIPLTMDPDELRILVDQTRTVANAVLKEQGTKLGYLVGTMIEVPRAALMAEKLARHADFFSFGTNDLTQMTMALSRDDSGRFLPEYTDPRKAGIFPAHPFQSLDIAGVGMLIRMACEKAHSVKPKIKLGVCGEHGGDPRSIRFFHQLGLTYVSCSPFRVPIARLAAAQAAIEHTPTTRASRPAKPRARAAGSKARTSAKAKPARRTAKKKAGKASGPRGVSRSAPAAGVSGHKGPPPKSGSGPRTRAPKRARRLEPALV